jgi:hypothetical protein
MVPVSTEEITGSDGSDEAQTYPGPARCLRASSRGGELPGPANDHKDRWRGMPRQRTPGYDEAKYVHFCPNKVLALSEEIENRIEVMLCLAR